MASSPEGHPEIERIVAPNPGPMTLEGTNTYVIAAERGAYVIDPGPADEAHVAAIRTAAQRHGEILGVLLTHSHADHSAAVPMLAPAPLVWGSIGSGDETAGEPGTTGQRPDPPTHVGPFLVVPTPGHAADHVCLLLGAVCFSGDLILGEGSSFVPPDGGSLAALLESLRTVRDLRPQLLCPGHGPYVYDAVARAEEYIEHRLERERKLLAALADGERSRERLLERAWDDVPAELRPAAALVMQAHLDKLAAEGRLQPAELTD